MLTTIFSLFLSPLLEFQDISYLQDVTNMMYKIVRNIFHIEVYIIVNKLESFVITYFLLLPDYVNFLAGEGKCQALLMPQLG
jgi:hypothetical protein